MYANQLVTIKNTAKGINIPFADFQSINQLSNLKNA